LKQICPRQREEKPIARLDVDTKASRQHGLLNLGRFRTYAIFLEAFILLAPAAFIGIPRAGLECIWPPFHDLLDRLGANAAGPSMRLPVLAVLALTARCA
jgi:hypothetical protein